jgi:hypothetical protein
MAPSFLDSRTTILFVSKGHGKEITEILRFLIHYHLLSDKKEIHVNDNERDSPMFCHFGRGRREQAVTKGRLLSKKWTLSWIYDIWARLFPGLKGLVEEP